MSFRHISKNDSVDWIHKILNNKKKRKKKKIYRNNFHKNHENQFPSNSDIYSWIVKKIIYNNLATNRTSVRSLNWVHICLLQVLISLYKGSQRISEVKHHDVLFCNGWPISETMCCWLIYSFSDSSGVVCIS